MKKRIKHYSPETEKENHSMKGGELRDDFYLKLLLNDLKKDPCEMPKYSLWSEMVNKFLCQENS